MLKSKCVRRPRHSSCTVEPSASQMPVQSQYSSHIRPPFSTFTGHTTCDTIHAARGHCCNTRLINLEQQILARSANDHLMLRSQVSLEIFEDLYNISDTRGWDQVVQAYLQTNLRGYWGQPSAHTINCSITHIPANENQWEPLMSLKSHSTSTVLLLMNVSRCS